MLENLQPKAMDILLVTSFSFLHRTVMPSSELALTLVVVVEENSINSSQ